MFQDSDSDYPFFGFDTGENVSRENNAESDVDFDNNESGIHKTVNRHFKLGKF